GNGGRNCCRDFCRVVSQCEGNRRFPPSDRNSFLGENGGGIVRISRHISELHNQNGISRQCGMLPEGCRAVDGAVSRSEDWERALQGAPLGQHFWVRGV